MSDLDIQFGLQEYDVYRATALERMPFRIKYLGIPEVRTFLQAYLFGWIWDETPNHICNNSQTFDNQEISVSIQMQRNHIFILHQYIFGTVS